MGKLWRGVVLAVVCSSMGFLVGTVTHPRKPAAPNPAGPPAVDLAREAPPPAGAGNKVPAFAAPPVPVAPARAQTDRPTNVAVEGLPGPVREIVARLSADHPIKGLRIEAREDAGEPSYRLTFNLEGGRRELSYDSRGTLLLSETQLGSNEVPPRVQQAISEALPGAGLVKAKRLEGTRVPVPIYEVEVRAEGARRQLQVKETGEVVAVKEK